MKNLIKQSFLVVLLVMLSSMSYAQPLNRKADTKIVDALNQLPADNQALYNRLMGDIESTDTDGVEMLIEMLERNDDSRTKVEYALDAYAAYAGSNTFDAQKREALKAVINKHIAQINSTLTGNDAKDAEANPWAVTNRALLNRMLRHIGGFTPNPVEAVPDVAAIQKSLAKTLKSNDRQTRMSAIHTINTFGTQEQISASLAQAEKMLPKLSDDAKQDVLYWMGINPDKANTTNAKALLKSKNEAVVSAAAWAITRVGKAEDTQSVAQLLKGTAEQRTLAEACLKAYPGNVTNVVTDVVGDDITPEALAIIAARKDASKSDKVYAALKSDNAEIRAAGYKALKDVVGKDDLNTLYTELETCDAQYQPDVQEALLSSLSSVDNPYATLQNRMEKVGADKKALYWPVALKVADNKTLLSLARDFNKNGDDALLKQSIDCYLATIKNDVPGAEQLLMLREAMELSKDANQQNTILSRIGKTNVLPAVFYAGRYLDNKTTEQAAAHAIRVLTSGHNEMNGPEVKALMVRAKNAIAGGDADYQQREVQQQLDKLANEDEGYVSMFNGKDLTGWKGLLAEPYDNPYKRAALKEKELKKLQTEADELMNQTWSVKDGVIEFNGKGRSLATEKKYGNFEMFVDWRLLPGPEPDAGIYLRGTPQVQIWDTARTNVGAEVGSGGLYNNQVNASKPLCVADNPLGEWNSFYIKMVDERVTVYLNGRLVVDNVIMENYWDRSLPLMLKEQIELQAHGSVVQYRDLYIHELPQAEPYALSAKEKKEGYQLLFDGTNLNNFQGDFVNYHAEDGCIYVKPRGDGFGNLYTKEQYQDFIFRFEFKLTPGANNGIGVRAEMGKDAAYYGMEIQVLDHYNKIYQPGLRDYQYHGSVYGIIPTQNRDCLRPVGEWNEEEIYIKGTHVRVTLNGTVITEGDIKEATKNGTYDHNEHPGLFNKTGYIGFLGHGSELWFRHVRVKRL